MTKVAPSKDELERQKLALEIQELQRKWWQRPVYLSILLPMVLASLTVLAGILSGYFDRERAQLKRDIGEAKKRLEELNALNAQYESIMGIKRLEILERHGKAISELLREFATPTPEPKQKE